MQSNRSAALIVAVGLSAFAAARAVGLEDGPAYTVGVASTDGKTLVEDMPVISHEWQLRDIALPGTGCPNGYSSRMILRLRLTYIADDAVAVGCQDNCAWNFVESRVRRFDKSGIVSFQCGKDLVIRIKKANSSAKPTSHSNADG